MQARCQSPNPYRETRSRRKPGSRVLDGQGLMIQNPSQDNPGRKLKIQEHTKMKYIYKVQERETGLQPIGGGYVDQNGEQRHPLFNNCPECGDDNITVIPEECAGITFIDDSRQGHLLKQQKDVDSVIVIQCRQCGHKYRIYRLDSH